MLSLRNNLSFGFGSQLSLLKRYLESTMLVMQRKIVWLRFKGPGLFAFTLRRRLALVSLLHFWPDYRQV